MRLVDYLPGGIASGWASFLFLVAAAAVGQEGSGQGVDVRDLIVIDRAYVISVEIDTCRDLEQFVADSYGDVSLGWFSRLAVDVVSNSSLVVVSGELKHRAAVSQDATAEYYIDAPEEVGETGTWFVHTDSDRGGTCSDLIPTGEAIFVTTLSWCDVFPSKDASCFFEVDYAYRPSPSLLSSLDRRR